MRKVLSICKKIVDVLLTMFVIAFVLVVCLQRFSNNEISLFSFRMFTVVSGSMEPEYNIGDVLISKEVEPEKIEVGDDVSYLGKSGTFNGKVVTHRVIEIDRDKDNKLVFHTKGLANPAEDPLVYEDQLYGVVVYQAKILSMIYKCVSNPNGMFFFIVIPILYVIGSEMIYFMLDREEKRRIKLKESKKENDVVEEKVTTKKKKVSKKKYIISR